MIDGRTPIVHFLHIGKTGGTAVKHALRDSLALTRCTLLLHGHNVKLMDVPEGEKAAFFLRDPVSRFCSGFYSRKRRGRPRFDLPWSPGEEVAFGRFPTPDALGTALSSKDAGVRQSARDAMRSIGHLKRSYWEWFGDAEYFQSRQSDLFFIGFQETLNDDFRSLLGKIGLPDDLQLPTDDIETHRTPADCDRRLSDEAVKNLTEWYAVDYQLLESCRAAAALVNSRPVTI